MNISISIDDDDDNNGSNDSWIAYKGNGANQYDLIQKCI